MKKAPLCPIHQRPLVMFCPACRGAKGGQTVTDAKVEHLASISAAGVAARWGTKSKKKRKKQS